MSFSSPVSQLKTQLQEIKKTVPNICLGDESFADFMDDQDELRRFRSKFQFPLRGSIPIGKSM